MFDEFVPYGRYECDQCGACCKGTVIVEADYLDVRREPRLIQLQVGSYRASPRELEDEGKIVLLSCSLESPCPCLDADNRCTIYPTRPNVCAAFEAGGEKCQAARAQFGIEPLPTITASTPSDAAVEHGTHP